MRATPLAKGRGAIEGWAPALISSGKADDSLTAGRRANRNTSAGASRQFYTVSEIRFRQTKLLVGQVSVAEVKLHVVLIVK